MAANIAQADKANWKPINTYLPDELWRRLKAQAVMRDIEVRELLAELIAKHLDTPERKRNA